MAYAFNQCASGGCSQADQNDLRWSERQIARATERAVKEYWESIKRMTPDEFLAAFPDWASNPLLSITMDPVSVQSWGLQILQEQAGLGEHLISHAQRYAAEQLAEVYGSGIAGTALVRHPKTQAVWNIATHPRLPDWQFWRRGPEITIACSLGAGQCVYGVQQLPYH
jgi:hypothetical protein